MHLMPLVLFRSEASESLKLTSFIAIMTSLQNKTQEIK